MLPFNIVSEFSRTLALAVRLFGNMMSGTMILGILLIVTPLSLFQWWWAHWASWPGWSKPIFFPPLGAKEPARRLMPAPLARDPCGFRDPGLAVILFPSEARYNLSLHL
jgi:hypothetical protein